nr:MAG TPA: hypothetical protein [Caudoviricetes sp.]
MAPRQGCCVIIEVQGQPTKLSWRGWFLLLACIMRGRIKRR